MPNGIRGEGFVAFREEGIELGSAPAPETPLLASMMMPVVSMRPSWMRGARARIEVLV